MRGEFSISVANIGFNPQGEVVGVVGQIGGWGTAVVMIIAKMLGDELIGMGSHLSGGKVEE